MNLNSNIRNLSLGFMLIFAGFNAVQQFTVAFFDNLNMPAVGFKSLLLVYIFLTITNPIAAAFVSRFGAKIAMLAGSVTYSTFILSVVLANPTLVYIASILLGVGASLLWTGQGTYIVKISSSKNYGANSGIFYSLVSLGSATSVVVLGFLITRFSFETSFFLFSALSLLGIVFLFKLLDTRTSIKRNSLELIGKSMRSRTALRLSTIWFSFSFIFGLVISVIPLEVGKLLNFSWIGILSSSFFIMPVLFSYYFGKLSDIKGRKFSLLYSSLAAIFGLLILYLFQSPILLVTGIFLLAISFAIARPMTFALVGDLSVKKNLEFLTALFLTVGNLGTVSALLLSTFVEVKTVYLLSFLTITVSGVILLSLMSQDFGELKSKLVAEVG